MDFSGEVKITMSGENLVDLGVLTKMGVFFDKRRNTYVHRSDLLPPSFSPSSSASSSSAPYVPQPVSDQQAIITNQKLMD